MALTREQIIDLIITEAEKNGIPPMLALSIAMAESSFDPGAPGDDGESLGIFQVNDIHELSREFRLDPVKNIKWWASQYAPPRLEAFKRENPGVNLNNLTPEVIIKAGERIQGNKPEYSYRFGQAFQSLNAGVGSGEPWEVNPSLGPATDIEDDSDIFSRFAKVKGKSSPVLDRINQQIKEYMATMPDATSISPEQFQDWVNGLTNLTDLRTQIAESEKSGSFIENFLDQFIGNYIAQGGSAAEAMAEGQRMLTQYNLDVGGVTGPQAMKEQRFKDDAQIIADNWNNARTQSQDELAAWRDKSSAYTKAADQAQDIFKTIFPYITSKAGPHELNTMKSGGPMNQLFNRLGMEYTPPEPIGTTEINPADYANQALIAAGPQPSVQGPPPQLKTMTEALGPVPELPSPPQLPEIPSSLEIINKGLDILAELQKRTPSSPNSVSSYLASIGPQTAGGYTGSGEPWGDQQFSPEIYGSPAPTTPSSNTSIPGIATPIDVLRGYRPQGGQSYGDLLNEIKNIGGGIGAITGWSDWLNPSGTQEPGITEFLRKLLGRPVKSTDRTGIGFYRNLGGY